MSDHPRQRPVRWGRFLVILSLILLGIGLLLHWMWSSGARRRLDAQVAAYRAAGEPIEPQDFVVTGVADADNAALDLRAAAAAIDRTTEVWTTFKDLRDEPALPLRPDELELLRRIVSSNPGVIPKVESAVTKRGIDWQIAFTTPLLLTLLPDLQPQRDLARFLRADAQLAHTDGDHARAVRRVGDILFQSRALAQQPLLVPALVSTGLGAMASDLAVDLAPDLRIAENEPGAATPQQVRDLIARFLDESAPNDALRNGLLGERMAQLDIARAFATGAIGANGAPTPGGGARFMGAVLKPTALADGRLMMRHTTAVLEAASSSETYPAFKAKAPAFPRVVKDKHWLHIVAAIFMPSLDRAMAVNYRVRVERRAAAVALAVRLYAVEHDGRMPATLDQLVPAYLPAVPRDAMSPTTQPLRFAPSTRPVIYSVGENGVDDGGSEQPTTSRPRPDYSKWDRLDAVTHLQRQPRPQPEEPEAYDVGEAGIEPATEPTTRPADATEAVSP